MPVPSNRKPGAALVWCHRPPHQCCLLSWCANVPYDTFVRQHSESRNTNLKSIKVHILGLFILNGKKSSRASNFQPACHHKHTAMKGSQVSHRNSGHSGGKSLKNSSEFCSFVFRATFCNNKWLIPPLPPLPTLIISGSNLG